MAGSTILKASQKYFFNLSGKCWNFQVSHYSKQKVILEMLANTPKPKKPKTPLLKFVSENKQEAAAKHPDKTSKELSALLTSQWEELSVNEKQKYIDIYEKENAEYQEKLKKFKDPFTGMNKNQLMEKINELKNLEIPDANTIIKKMLFKTLNKPKAPSGPFVKYLTQISQKRGEKIKVQEASAQWKNLPEEEKKKYVVEFAKDWEQYEKDLEKWEKDMLREGHVDVVRVRTLKEVINKST